MLSVSSSLYNAIMDTLINHYILYCVVSMSFLVNSHFMVVNCSHGMVFN